MLADMPRAALPIALAIVFAGVALTPFPIAGRTGVIHASIGGVVMCSIAILTVSAPVQAWSLWLFLRRRSRTHAAVAAFAGIACPAVSIPVQAIGLANESIGYRDSAPVTTAIMICFIAICAGAAASLVLNSILYAATRRDRVRNGAS